MRSKLWDDYFLFYGANEHQRGCWAIGIAGFAGVRSLFIPLAKLPLFALNRLLEGLGTDSDLLGMLYVVLGLWLWLLIIERRVVVYDRFLQDTRL